MPPPKFKGPKLVQNSSHYTQGRTVMGDGAGLYAAIENKSNKAVQHVAKNSANYKWQNCDEGRFEYPRGILSDVFWPVIVCCFIVYSAIFRAKSKICKSVLQGVCCVVIFWRAARPGVNLSMKCCVLLQGMLWCAPVHHGERGQGL